ncbi:hypothetical protein VTN00DRAFT_5322 [Thermoascus crustaceus]|uniref:uncharacterized protein n=1 Tax=Thermoascus crustaceus TaxID=5088 RepID=UPI0037425290
MDNTSTTTTIPDFLPYPYNPSTEANLRFFHVYDENLSQTPYIPGYGIQSGDINGSGGGEARCKGLYRNGVFFFSTQDLVSERMLGSDAGLALWGTWFAIDFIPDGVVEDVLPDSKPVN